MNFVDQTEPRHSLKNELLIFKMWSISGRRLSMEARKEESSSLCVLCEKTLTCSVTERALQSLSEVMSAH